jgi:hypothetical protein
MLLGVSGSFKWTVVKRRALSKPSVDIAPPDSGLKVLRIVIQAKGESEKRENEKNIKIEINKREK